MAGVFIYLKPFKIYHMRRFFVAVILSVIFLTHAFSQTKSPATFLGYELGERFSQHHQVVDYFEHVSDVNENVKLVKYGHTYEKRPLYLAFISSEENIKKLEDLRLDQLRSARIIEGSPSQNDIAIVWLSYNVHGNESVSTEVSMQTLFELIKPENKTTKEWLKNTIVIIDPCINPDGRERYVNWFMQKTNTPYNKNPDAIEHHEPWPRGRANHYLFDLNRDWAWATQIETKQRLAVYNKWMPHIHVDFHEQGVNSPYYFAPAAEPYHEVVTQFQKDFQFLIGKNHAKYFDQKGWLYFTKEIFDLLYPSYGDTYPTFNGAIGMTYEQGGSGAAGLGVKTKEGGELTLKDRIDHHLTTSLSTVEMASKNAALLNEEYLTYFKNASESPIGDIKTYLIKNTNDDKVENLIKLLDVHDIQYGSPSEDLSLKGFSYKMAKDTKLTSDKNDLLISVYQPKSNLVKALFEPQTKLTDSLTYDLTAWSLPYARGLDAYAIKSKIDVVAYQKDPLQKDSIKIENPYAYISKWNSVKDVAYLAYLLEKKVKVRFSTKDFAQGEKKFGAGSLVITRAGNEKLMGFDSIVRTGAVKFERQVIPVQTGWTTHGSDFGSNKVSYMKPPKIAVLSGPSVGSLNFGAIWHFFEQQIGYQLNVLDGSYFSNVDLNKYNVLILPNGNYKNILNKKQMTKLEAWIERGGKVVVIGSGISVFAASDAFKISKYENKEMEKKAKKRRDSILKMEQLSSYNLKERNYLSNRVQGGVFKTTLDHTNPLGYGYKDHYYTLKNSRLRYPYLKNGYNVSVIKDKSSKVSGFVGKNVIDSMDESLVFGIEKKGKGMLVYMVDDPLFRSFWENGKLLFSNAIFMVGNE